MPPSHPTRTGTKAGACIGEFPITESTVKRIICGLKKEKPTVPIVAAQQRKNRKRRSSAADAARLTRPPFQGKFILKFLLR
jgi:hypothetical protein